MGDLLATWLTRDNDACFSHITTDKSLKFLNARLTGALGPSSCPFTATLPLPNLPLFQKQQAIATCRRDYGLPDLAQACGPPCWRRRSTLTRAAPRYCSQPDRDPDRSPACARGLRGPPTPRIFSTVPSGGARFRAPAAIGSKSKKTSCYFISFCISGRRSLISTNLRPAS